MKSLRKLFLKIKYSYFLLNLLSNQEGQTCSWMSPQEHKIYEINEIKVGKDLILAIIEQQHQIFGTQKNTQKHSTTEILDFKKEEYEEYEIY